MNLKKITYLLVICTLLLSTCMLSTHAATPAITTELYNLDAGSPKDPKNIKFNITLPKSYGRTSFSADDLGVYIYPQALDIATGKRDNYRAEKLLLWQHNNQLFVDIRKPPTQRAGGNHTIYVELKKNERPIYKAELTEKVRYDNDEVDVVLVIDSSLSMHDNDPDQNRLRAAKAFVDMARTDKRIRNIGVVSFNSKSTVKAKLTPVRNSRRLHKAIDSIGASGRTNIGSALESSMVLLDDAYSKRTAVVLLTDGKNDSSIYMDQHLDFAKRKIPIYCIGLSYKADTQLLDKIAEETGASSFKASTDKDLLGIYQRIASVISRREVIFNKTIPYNKDKVSIPVDNSIKDISFMLNAGIDEVILKLTSPTGKIFEVEPSKYNNVAEIRMSKPEAGLWTAIISNRSSKRELELNVTGDTSLYLDSFPPLMTKDRIFLSGTLADNGDTVQNSKVQVISQKGSIKLYDDGLHNDGEAGDGVYTCSLPVERELDLHLLMRAWGTKQLPYIRQTDAGTLRRRVIKVEAPVVKYALSTNDDIDFPTTIAGEEVAHDITLTYTGLPKNISAVFTELKCSVYTIDPEYISINQTQINEGENKSTVTLKVPEQMPSGTYTGSVKFTTADTDLTLPISVNILDAELIVKNPIINLGYIKEDRMYPCSVDLLLQSPSSSKFTISAMHSDFKILYDFNKELTANTQQSVEFSFKAANISQAEAQKQDVIIKAGDLKQTVTINYLLTPKGETRLTNLLAHEMALPEISKTIVSTSMTHEMSLPPVVEVAEVAAPQSEIIEPKVLAAEPLVAKAIITTPSPAIIDAMETEQDFLLLLIITATFALTIILLILRKLSSHRMVRIGLLSLTLHLPIVAIVASYILVSREVPITKTYTTPITSMVTASVPTEKSYIKENLTSLKDLNKTTPPSTPDSLLLATTEVTEEASLIDEINSELTQLPRRRIEAPRLPVSTDISHEIESPTHDTQALGDFNFASVATKAHTTLTPEFYTQNKEAIQQELAPQVDPETPLANVFAEITNEPTAETRSENVSPELAEAVDIDISIYDEIDSILSSKATLATNHRAEAISPNSSPSIISNEFDIEVPELASDDNLLDIEISQKLSRNLTEEIDKTSQLRSLAQNTPQTEEPDQMLTSIDNTAPIEIEDEFELEIPSDELPDIVTDLSKDLLSHSERADDIIFETTPRHTSSEALMANLDEAIPGITSDGLCLDLESINESVEINRSDLSVDHGEISSIAPATPEIDDLALDELVLSEAEPEILLLTPTDIIEDSAILEQLIEIPSEDSLEILVESDTKPSVISTIDNLDMDIDRKIDRLTSFNKQPKIIEPEISRIAESDVSGEVVTEEYIPLRPDLDQLTSSETALAPIKAEKIEEMPKGEIQNFQIKDTPSDFSEALLHDSSISKIAVHSESSVKIINSPQRLTNKLDTNADIVKLPTSFKDEALSSTDSGINSIALNVGILSDSGRDIITTLPNFKDVNMYTLNNSTGTDSLVLSCQLIITNKKIFSSKEIDLLRDYITSGGHLWIQDRGIPTELSSIGKISLIEQDDTLFNSTYNVSKERILFAEELLVNSERAIIATGCRDIATNKPLLTNVFVTFLGSLKEENDIGRTEKDLAILSKMWQNFSGVDESTLGWKGPKWGNIIQTGIAPDGQGGEALRVLVKAGREDITSINYIIPDHEGRRIDLSDNSSIVLDIFNANKKFVGVSLGLTTESPREGWNEFETQKINLKAGWNRGVIIPLTGFRSRRDPDDGYIHALNAANNCARVSLYFTNIKDGGNLLIDNIKWGD